MIKTYKYVIKNNKQYYKGKNIFGSINNAKFYDKIDEAFRDKRHLENYLDVNLIIQKIEITMIQHEIKYDYNKIILNLGKELKYKFHAYSQISLMISTLIKKDMFDEYKYIVYCKNFDYDDDPYLIKTFFSLKNNKAFAFKNSDSTLMKIKLKYDDVLIINLDIYKNKNFMQSN